VAALQRDFGVVRDFQAPRCPRSWFKCLCTRGWLAGLTRVHRRRVWSNWLRTLAWTGRGVLVLVMLRAM
jgi:hypothetical protein